MSATSSARTPRQGYSYSKVKDTLNLWQIEPGSGDLQFDSRCATMPLATAGRGQFQERANDDDVGNVRDSEHSPKRRRA